MKGQWGESMKYFKINGVDVLHLFTENGIKWQRNDIDGDNAGRTMDGTMWRDRVTTKIRLDCTCRPLTEAEAKLILNLILPVYVEVEYYDPMYGPVTKTMYSNNVPITLRSYLRNGETFWTGLSFPLIER